MLIGSPTLAEAVELTRQATRRLHGSYSHTSTNSDEWLRYLASDQIVTDLSTHDLIALIHEGFDHVSSHPLEGVRPALMEVVRRILVTLSAVDDADATTETRPCPNSSPDAASAMDETRDYDLTRDYDREHLLGGFR